jgi:GxxExxY protein
MEEDYKHSDLTNVIIKAFYKVYKALGYGFQEKVYVNALAIELRKSGYDAVREAPVEVCYDNQVVAQFAVDLLVDKKVIVETKAARELIADHEAQLLNYLKATIYEVGLLLNFGPEPTVIRKAFDNSRKGSLCWIRQKQLDADKR